MCGPCLRLSDDVSSTVVDGHSLLMCMLRVMGESVQSIRLTRSWLFHVKSSRERGAKSSQIGQAPQDRHSHSLLSPETVPRGHVHARFASVAALGTCQTCGRCFCMAVMIVRVVLLSLNDIENFNMMNKTESYSIYKKFFPSQKGKRCEP